MCSASVTWRSGSPATTYSQRSSTPPTESLHGPNPYPDFDRQGNGPALVGRVAKSPMRACMAAAACTARRAAWPVGSAVAGNSAVSASPLNFTTSPLSFDRDNQAAEVSVEQAGHFLRPLGATLRQCPVSGVKPEISANSTAANCSTSGARVGSASSARARPGGI